MDFLVITLIAVFTSLTAPLLLIYFTARTRRSERREDYRRQDEIAERVAEVARATAASAAATKTQLNGISNQATQIHTLVNSDMTSARQAELDQTRVVLAVLRRVVAVTVEKGLPPLPDDLIAIQEAVDRISELESILADRLTQLRLSEQERKEEQ